MALQIEEKSNYHLDVKFQESYLKKVVKLLECQLSEGAALDKDLKGVNPVSINIKSSEDVEEGELPDSHGSFFCLTNTCTPLLLGQK